MSLQYTVINFILTERAVTPKTSAVSNICCSFNSLQAFFGRFVVLFERLTWWSGTTATRIDHLLMRMTMRKMPQAMQWCLYSLLTTALKKQNKLRDLPLTWLTQLTSTRMRLSRWFYIPQHVAYAPKHGAAWEKCSYTVLFSAQST